MENKKTQLILKIEDGDMIEGLVSNKIRQWFLKPVYTFLFNCSCSFQQFYFYTVHSKMDFDCYY